MQNGALERWVVGGGVARRQHQLSLAGHRGQQSVKNDCHKLMSDERGGGGARVTHRN